MSSLSDAARSFAGLHEARGPTGVVTLEIDNPPSNALGDALRARLAEAIAAIDADTAVRAVVLKSRGPVFCAGDDLKEAAASGADLERLADWSRLFARVEACRAPIVAAIQGPCAGGGLELALCCDVRVASTQARFVAAGVNVGLIASAGRLPRLVGLGRAKHMLLTGAPCDADTAERWGLVTAVAAPADLDRTAQALAERIASRAPLSVEAVKRVAGAAVPVGADQDAEIARLAATEDHAAALEAFSRKAQPVFHRR